MWNVDCSPHSSSSAPAIDWIGGQRAHSSVWEGSERVETEGALTIRWTVCFFSRTLNGNGATSMYRPNFNQTFQRPSPFPSLFPTVAVASATAAVVGALGNSTFPSNVSPLPLANGMQFYTTFQFMLSLIKWHPARLPEATNQPPQSDLYYTNIQWCTPYLRGDIILPLLISTLVSAEGGRRKLRQITRNECRLSTPTPSH